MSDPHSSDLRPRTEAPFLAADEIAGLTGGTLLLRSSRPVRGAAVDSRQVQPDNLFVALAGERTDGHLFLADALDAGASALLIRDESPATRELVAAGADVTIVRVPDTLAGLQAVAAGWRARFSPLVVGVTGSIAKTSTKEAIAAVLSTRLVTLRSEGNQNNEIGLPLTLLRMGPEHEAAVLEMGMFVGGEIAQLAAMGRPRIGVVTAVREVHLSRIGTIDDVERAKGELVEALPADGVAILNADDPRVLRMASRTAARALTYGFDGAADVRAEAIESRGLDGMAFELLTPAGRATVETPVLGRHGVHNGLAAAAVGVAAGVDVPSIVAGLAQGWRAHHRSEIVRLPQLTIIDDCYNASPSSVLAALELLATLPGRHVAVLGEMLELGQAHERGHHEVGEAAARLADLLVVVGDGAAGIADAALGSLPADRVICVPDREAAVAVLRERLEPGDSILLKASRGPDEVPQFAWIVDELRRDPGVRGSA